MKCFTKAFINEYTKLICSFVEFFFIGQLLIGLEADEDGMLYTANYADGSIVQINPRYNLLERSVLI